MLMKMTAPKLSFRELHCIYAPETLLKQPRGIHPLTYKLAQYPIKLMTTTKSEGVD